jgi:hypothetical protein
MKLAQAFGLMVAYVVLLLAIYLVHAWYFPVRVVLYSAVLDAVLAAAGLLALVAVLPGLRRVFSGFEYLLLTVIWVLGGYAFAISGPTVLDRSLSFYLLEKLDQRGGGIRQDQIGSVFVDEYMPEYRLVDVRLTEQIESGTIAVVDGCVALTSKGRLIASVSRYLRQHFLPRKRLLMGDFTDALNHPFLRSPTGPRGYECQIP